MPRDIGVSGPRPPAPQPLAPRTPTFFLRSACDTIREYAHLRESSLGSRSKLMKGLLIFALLLGAAAAADYAGAEACRTCHPAEYDLQSRSAHAHTLAPSTPTQPGDWAFGAGMQAITFVSRVDREHYREHGESWYRALDGYGITPGHRNLGGVEFRTFDPAARILRCFACHSTGPLTLGAEDQVVPHELGVRCEVCHGAAAAHVRDPAHTRLRNPARMTAAEMNAFCANCHRLTLETGEESTDLRDPRNSRSQPLRLAASVCFQKSKGRLTCLTCHSPHAPLERSAVAYNAACQRCHAAPHHTQTVAGAACTECHMSSLRQGNLVFVNHRIAVYGPQDPLSPISVKPRP